jgi:hypothetical protein
MLRRGSRKNCIRAKGNVIGIDERGCAINRASALLVFGCAGVLDNPQIAQIPQINFACSGWIGLPDSSGLICEICGFPFIRRLAQAPLQLIPHGAAATESTPVGQSLNPHLSPLHYH